MKRTASQLEAAWERPIAWILRCHQHPLLYNALRLPRRNAEPIGHCSGVPQPCPVLESTPPIALPQICHQSTHLFSSDTGGFPLSFKPRLFRHGCRGEERSGKARGMPIGENLRWRENRHRCLTVSLTCGIQICMKRFALTSRSTDSVPLDIVFQPSPWLLPLQPLRICSVLFLTRPEFFILDLVGHW
jgi:hypothetical protein